REFDALAKSIHESKIGGFHVFGGTDPAPDVLLDANYGTVTLGQPLAAASLLNRLQAIAPYPLLNSADFETGVGFRMEGATAIPTSIRTSVCRSSRTRANRWSTLSSRRSGPALPQARARS